MNAKYDLVTITWFGKQRTIPARIYCNGTVYHGGPYDKEYVIVRRGEDEYGLRNDGTRYLLVYDDELRKP